jgi:hypothetical protein
MLEKRRNPLASTSRIAVLLAALFMWIAMESFSYEQSPPARGDSVEIAPGITVLWPAPWFVAERTKNVIEVVYPLQEENPKLKLKLGEKPRSAEALITAAARMAIEVQDQRTHAYALKRLAGIASEVPDHSVLTVIAGWPAIERRRTAPLPNPGLAEAPPPTATAVFVTSSIVVGTLIVRFETVIGPKADPNLADAALEIARSVRVKPGNSEIARRELGVVSRAILRPPALLQEVSPGGATAPKGVPLPPAPPPGPPRPGAAASVQSGFGELEVAVSDDGQHVVVAANSGFSFSDDGGRSFTRGGGTPCVYNGCDGDPSLAVGKSGAIYYSWIGFPTNEPGSFPPPNGATDTVSVSTDSGHTFLFAGNAVLCPSKAPNICFLPDQPHIAADRSSFSAAGLDRVYLVWRNFSNVSLTARIVCSMDGGSTWPEQTTVDVAGDFPRLAVGGDSSVYVVYVNNSTIMLRKFSSCDSGLVPQPSVTVASYVGPQACGNSPGPAPMPGLDRCNDGNIINSPTVTVDPVDPNHVSVAWATSTTTNNEDVMLADSTDGGLTFPRSVRVSSAQSARRFMPWACSLGGLAFVSWYDRRAATSANNDLTDYFIGNVSSKTGTLRTGSEINLSSNPDPQCATGWPCGTWETRDATSCSIQPQLAGRCGASWPGNGALCSFTTPQCPAGQQCTSWGGGCPKYGDYNGNACAAGRVYVAWASATAPPGLPPVTGINIFSAVFALPDIEITNLTVRGTKWCATVTATEAGQPVAGTVVIDGVTGSTNQQICFPPCSETVSDVECDPQRKPPCRIFHVREPIPCQGTVRIPGFPPVQISVGPP